MKVRISDTSEVRVTTEIFSKGFSKKSDKKNYNNGLVCENKQRLTFCSDQKVNV